MKLRPVSEDRLSIGQRMLGSLSLKTIATAVISIVIWHYTELLAVKDVHAEVRDVRGEVSTLRQQNTDQETRMNIQRDAIGHKIDKDTYDRDMRNVFDSLNRIQVSIDAVHTTLEARR